MPAGLAAAAIAVVLTAIVTGAAPALAQVIWRCGPGHYSQQACADGRPLESSDRSSPEQLSQARAATADRQRLALQLQRERLAVERVPASGANGIGPAPTRDAIKPGDSETGSRKGARARAGSPSKPFVAFVPGSKPAKPRKYQRPSQDRA